MIYSKRFRHQGVLVGLVPRGVLSKNSVQVFWVQESLRDSPRLFSLRINRPGPLGVWCKIGLFEVKKNKVKQNKNHNSKIHSKVNWFFFKVMVFIFI